MFCSFARVTLGSYFRKKALHCVVTFRPGMPTRLFSGLLDNSRIRQLADCQLADWTTRGLDNSRSRRCRQKNEN